MTPVKIGKVYDGYAEVLTDLEDKQLVIKNAYSLLMKLKNSEE
jgi:cobalt-zinc-cadmium efflux system membrane fusion protein